MTFPLWYLLIPYALATLGTGIFMFFNVYHVAKFGLQSVSTTVLILMYILLYLAILAWSATAILSYDWTMQVMLSDIIPFSTGGASSSFGL